MRYITNLFIIFLTLTFIPGCLDSAATPNKAEFVDKMAINVTKKFPKLKFITADEVLKKGFNNFVLVDVRSPLEREVSTLPEAINISDYKSLSSTLKPRIFYCTIGMRASRFVAENKDLPGESLVLKGGVLSWLHAGGKVHNNKGNEVSKVHVGSEAWNVTPKGIEAVWEK